LRVEDALAHVGAADIADKRLSTLSGGQQQRIAIARALVGQPELLLLDEPLANLDLMSQHNVVSILQHLHRVHGMTMIIVAHDLTPLRPLVTSAVYLLGGHARCVPLCDIDSALLSQLNGRPLTHEQLVADEFHTSN
jgi:zinc/manganese transport system ATP-binding protein